MSLPVDSNRYMTPPPGWPNQGPMTPPPVGRSAAISKIRRPSAGSDGFEPAGHLLESLRPALQEDCVNARRSS